MISWCEGKNWNEVDVKVRIRFDVKVRTEMISWCEGKKLNV